ncbi:site-specific integrase [Streptococcus pluranimalium]|uniref:site-specific integrase n=1 Tax=Streptococcus pluranimalium TaxID=82348 RepID=UPI0039FC6496
MKITKHKKKNGELVYRANIYLGVDQLTGKKARTTITAPTKKLLKSKARQAINDFETNGHSIKPKFVVKTYGELAQLWWDSYKHTVKPNTSCMMESIVRNHLLPVFADYPLDKITTPMIQMQVNDWASKANEGEKGAFQHYSLLCSLNRRILQYGVTLELLPFNPSQNILLPRKTRTKTKAKVKHLDQDNLKTFLTYLSQLEPTYQHMFEIMLYKTLLATGCRINELLALEWSDIDFDKAQISITKTLNRYRTVNSPKSKSSIRVIDIDQATLKMLKSYAGQQLLEAGYQPVIVFSPITDTYAKVANLRQRLKRHFRLASVEDVGFHGFRHTHASMLLNAGIPYKELQHRLGHTNISTTMDIYGHLSEMNQKLAVSFFENAINELKYN